MISRDEVRKIADLARLTLTEAETERYAGELSRIVEYIEQLNALDVSGIRPTAHAVDVQNVFREDLTADAGVIGKVIERAPQKDDGFFLVPKVVEK